MALDRTTPRPDLTYLRRRPKRGERPPAATPAATPSLSLSPAPPKTETPVTVPKAAPALPTVRVAGRVMLTPQRPMVTLDRRQSAIGSLAVEVTPPGRVNGVWELLDGTAGTVSESGGITTSPEFGRRSLVQLQQGRLLVGLRHVHRLRRLLLVLTELDPAGAGTTAVASLYDGSTVESAHESPAPAVVALAVYQVAGELVVRREGFGFPSLAEAAQAYGFVARWTPPLRR